MAVPQVQTRFTVGELDPLLYSRFDTDFYSSGSKTQTNTICLPEGGYKRRAGTLHVDRFHRQLTREAAPTIATPRGGTGANANDDNEATFLLTTTSVGVLNPYTVVRYDLGAVKDIAVIDVVNASLTSGTNNTEFFVQCSVDNIAWVTIGAAIKMSTTTSTTRVRVRNSTYRYVRFVRIGATNLGTAKVSVAEFNVFIEGAATSLAKRIDFKFNIDQTYVIFLTDKNISIYRNGAFLTDVRAIGYSQANLQTVYPTQTSDTAILFQENVEPHTLTRFDDLTWTFETTKFQNISNYDFTNADPTKPDGTITPSALDGLVVLTYVAGATPAFFTTASVGQYINGNGGRARITKWLTALTVEALMEIPFYTTAVMDNTVAPNDAWDYETGWEPAWSATRGWPRSATFFQQRLWIGGSLQRPRALWASIIGEFFDFDIGAARDSDAFEYDLDENDPIVSLVANRSLQIFTTGGEAAIIQSRTTPITPVNPSIVSQTDVGSEPGLKPVIVDGATLFMKNGGSSIGKFIFTEAEQAYSVSNISLLSSHLINTPVDLTVRKVTNDEEASYLMIVTGDGNLTFGCMLEEQNVKGFTKATTNGLFKNVATDKSNMYAVVERTINGVTNNFLERFDFNTYTDSAVQYTTGLPATVFTGLDHLEGETCRVVADGNVLDDVTVVGGSVTISRAATTKCEIGLNFAPLSETLPYANPEAIGPSTGKEKKTVEVYVRVHETSSLKINGQTIDFYSLSGVNPLDAINPIYSGMVNIVDIENWDTDATIRITQDDPLPMTILSIETRVIVE